MTLAEYLETQPYGRMKELEKEAEVGYSTLARIRGGQPVYDYRVAKRISLATGKVVSIPELCDDELCAPVASAPALASEVPPTAA